MLPLPTPPRRPTVVPASIWAINRNIFLGVDRTVYEEIVFRFNGAIPRWDRISVPCRVSMLPQLPPSVFGVLFYLRASGIHFVLFFFAILAKYTIVN